jgi:hypothetical protein
MRSAAIRFIYQKQLVLDGTFGLSSARLLVWIAMGIDDNNHGLPVAFFLFSAPSGTKATHAGYNTSILAKLLGRWKALFSADNFEPSVAITDTDAKERGALIVTWPNITLLLCRFHLRQCWTNKRNSLLGAGQANFFMAHVTSRISDLDKL